MLTLLDRIRAWRTAEPADCLPAYPIIALPQPPHLEAAIAAEIGRLNHYRAKFGIPHALSLEMWRTGLSVDDVLYRVSREAALAE